MALYLRQVIHKAPTAEELDKQADEELPEGLTRFLNLVLCGSDSMLEKCEKTERLVYSIGQDLCCAVTNGE